MEGLVLAVIGLIILYVITIVLCVIFPKINDFVNKYF